jgi:hypothetical protein
MQSTVFEVIVGVLIALAIIGTIVSAVAVYRGTRKKEASEILSPRQLPTSNSQRPR